jgi:hypothetical protein
MCSVLNLNTSRAGTSGSSRGKHVTDMSLQPDPHPNRLKAKKHPEPPGGKSLTYAQMAILRSKQKTVEAANKVS